MMIDGEAFGWLLMGLMLCGNKKRLRDISNPLPANSCPLVSVTTSRLFFDDGFSESRLCEQQLCELSDGRLCLGKKIM